MAHCGSPPRTARLLSKMNWIAISSDSVQPKAGSPWGVQPPLKKAGNIMENMMDRRKLPSSGISWGWFRINNHQERAYGTTTRFSIWLSRMAFGFSTWPQKSKKSLTLSNAYCLQIRNLLVPFENLSLNHWCSGFDRVPWLLDGNYTKNMFFNV
jgi:hypothetical protein